MVGIGIAGNGDEQAVHGWHYQDELRYGLTDVEISIHVCVLFEDLVTLNRGVQA